jgi:hypothetical protein
MAVVSMYSPDIAAAVPAVVRMGTAAADIIFCFPVSAVPFQGTVDRSIDRNVRRILKPDLGWTDQGGVARGKQGRRKGQKHIKYRDTFADISFSRRKGMQVPVWGQGADPGDKE